MPIEFACSRCHTKYQVKEELAGKSAKCAKCGEKLRIPASAASQVVAHQPKPAAPKPQPKPVAPAKTQADAGAASWLDEELEVEEPAAVQRAPAGKSCPGCGAALAGGAVLCIKCGYDTRSGEKLATRRVAATAAEKEELTEKSGLGMGASLLRGTVFCFIAALLGAFVWAFLAYLTEHEFAIVAWALGGLVGFGMAMGHEDDDGTWVGMIAAFMSLFGIMAAKIIIIVIFVGAAVASGELDLGVDIDEVELRRTVVAAAIAAEKLEAQGINADDVTEEQWEQAMAAARNEVAGLSEGQLQARVDQMSEEEELADKELAEEDLAAEELAEEEQQDQPAEEEVAAVAPAAAPIDVQAADQPAADIAPDAEVGLVSLFFSEMFQPIDGLFILLAFFTAYKVGSGTMTD